MRFLKFNGQSKVNGESAKRQSAIMNRETENVNRRLDFVQGLAT